MKMFFDDSELSFHHIGIATKHPEDSLNILQGMGYTIQVKGREQGINVALLTHNILPAMEIIWDFSEKSPITNFLKLQDTNCYHICFSTYNYEKVMRFLEENTRSILVSPLKPISLIKNVSVSFHFVKGIGLIELFYYNEGKNHA